MKLNKDEVKQIKSNLILLSEIDWMYANEKQLGELFFTIRDSFEKVLKYSSSIANLRIIEIHFQKRLMLDNEQEYPKTQILCVQMFKDLLEKILKFNVSR